MNEFSLDLFATRFFEFTVDSELCLNVLKEIHEKKTDIHIASNAFLSMTSADYMSDYFHSVKLNSFESIMSKISEVFVSQNMSFHLKEYWTAFYRGKAGHSIHTHSKNILEKVNYSGILYLSNFGSTTFFSVNPSSFDHHHVIGSKLGRLIMFPSNVPHQTLNETELEEDRYVVPFNCEIRYEQSI